MYAHLDFQYTWAYEAFLEFTTKGLPVPLSTQYVETTRHEYIGAVHTAPSSSTEIPYSHLRL
jgi:hypothetical protein